MLAKPHGGEKMDQLDYEIAQVLADALCITTAEDQTGLYQQAVELREKLGDQRDPLAMRLLKELRDMIEN